MYLYSILDLESALLDKLQGFHSQFNNVLIFVLFCVLLNIQHLHKVPSHLRDDNGKACFFNSPKMQLSSDVDYFWNGC